jgi:hypothetical protein
MEEWKEVEGWNGKYEVSNTGEVRNAWDNVPVAQVLNGIPQYHYVNLTHPDGWRKMERVHRLVAFAFVPNSDPETKDVVDHEDRDKTNNHYSNLRWVTHQENMRNKDGALMIDGMFLKDYVEGYDNPYAAYTYISSNALKLGSIELAVEKYETYIRYGFRLVEVEWEGQTVNLNELCTQLGKDYFSVRNRIAAYGWDIWSAVNDLPPASFYRYSFEVQSETGVAYWYPTKEYFRLEHGRSTEVLTKLLDEGYNYEGILNYTGLEYLKQTIRGVTGNIKELCAHFGVSEGAVTTNMLRKGMTLEEALFAPRQRVKRLSINGVYNSPKYWYESFGINAKTANQYKSDKKLTFKETFEYFGVDTSEMVISTV